MDESGGQLLPEPIRPGRRLGSNYVVGERLGRGAMGVVHEATTHDGRPLAVKFLRAELAADHKTVARFLQERQIFRKVQHPNVVQVHDLVAEGDDLAIVMERVTGGDLKDRIAARSLTPRQSMQIAADIAAGLAAIHQASVVHRDLKPANILLGGNLSPKISDFGISRLVTEAMTRTSATIGTPIYMAPEAADARGADAPADVYALGIIMYEMLLGRPPFAEGGTFAVLRAHAMDPPPRIDGIPAPLSELIDQMLAKEPGDRPTIDLAHKRITELLALVDDEAQPVAVPGPAAGGAAASSGEVTGQPVGGATEVVTGRAAAAGVAGAAGVGAGLGAGIGADVSGDPAVQSGGQPVTPGPPPPPQPAAPIPQSVPVAEPMASSAPAFSPPSNGGRGGTGGGVLPNRLPRRAMEAGLALASVAALVVVVFLAMNRGGDDLASGDPSSPTTVADEGSDDDDGPIGLVDPGDGEDGESDDAEGEGEGEGNGTDGGTDESTSTTEGRTATTANGRNETSTSRSTTSTTHLDTSTSSTTTTTRPTTTTSTTRPTTTSSTTTTTTTTTTTAPAAVPIQIVSGPTRGAINATSFSFEYHTNNVCGTGRFTVREESSGTVVGSFTGDNVCYGPRHGGFPGLQSSPAFRNFDIQPGTTYEVLIEVRGTQAGAGDSKPSGSGSDTGYLRVTTSG